MHEDEARQQGFGKIAGVDEAGRGPLAGPVVAAACIIPAGLYIVDVDDSKKLTPEKRRVLYDQITKDERISVGVGVISHEEIDRINILNATIQAMLLAVVQLSMRPDFLLIDGLELLQPQIPCKKIIGGDGKSHAIAAASVIAKETRDRIMVDEHKKWPEYGFDKHKGYGTPEHLAAIKKHGPCPIHRMTFAPMSKKGE